MCDETPHTYTKKSSKDFSIIYNFSLTFSSLIKFVIILTFAPQVSLFADSSCDITV